MRFALKQNKKFPFSSHITAFASPEAEGISKVGTGVPELKSSPAKSPKYQIEEGGGEEEERQGDKEKGRPGDDWTIGRCVDVSMCRCGDVRRDIRLSIVDCRLSIFFGFHCIDHIEMIGIKVGSFGEKSKEFQLDSQTVPPGRDLRFAPIGQLGNWTVGQLKFV